MVSGIGGWYWVACNRRCAGCVSPLQASDLPSCGWHQQQQRLLLRCDACRYFIALWRGAWSAFFKNSEVGDVKVLGPTLLGALDAACYVVPRLFPHPALILCCHLPQLGFQLYNNSMSLRLGYLGTKANGLPFPLFYVAASALGFTSGTLLVGLCLTTGEDSPACARRQSIMV